MIEERGAPHGILLAVVVALVVIVPFFFGDDRASFISSIFTTGQPDSIHRASGSPVGVALFLVLILFLLYNRFSIFGGADDE
ncbi:unnamed protein product [Lupinus luteus]|uniref:Transmembrane protein n=1 Tax=Lupinus luteus TaxID=3873 RepID=A0AAV1XWU3_LUPLU